MRQPVINVPSKKIVLRPYKKDDKPSLIKSINDKKIEYFTLHVPYPYKKKDADEWILKQKKYSKEKPRTNYSFAVDRDGEVIGGVSLMKINYTDNNAEIGYWLSKKYRNMGIMTSVVKAISTFGFKGLNLKRIYAYIIISNEASARVLEKAGYKHEGTRRKNIWKNGKYLDDYVFAKIQR